MARTWSAPPVVAASAGALIRDPSGRLLILKPTYKSGWTLPGGVMEADGETPWDACRREVREETGLTVSAGRLVCVDTRPAKPGRLLGLRFLFACEVDDADVRGAIRQQPGNRIPDLFRFAEAFNGLRLEYRPLELLW